MGLGICVHNAHVVNNVSPIFTEVMDKEVTLLLCEIYRWRVVWDCCGFGPGRICLWPLHGATCEDDRVVAHVRGGESFSGQVHYPVTELVVTRSDKAAPITVKGKTEIKGGVAAVALLREVWGL